MSKNLQLGGVAVSLGAWRRINRSVLGEEFNQRLFGYIGTPQTPTMSSSAGAKSDASTTVSGGGGGGRGFGGKGRRGGSNAGKAAGAGGGMSRSYPRGVGLDFRKLAGLTLLGYIDHHGTILSCSVVSCRLECLGIVCAMLL